jgi:hypothetical protein
MTNFKKRLDSIGGSITSLVVFNNDLFSNKFPIGTVLVLRGDEWESAVGDLGNEKSVGLLFVYENNLYGLTYPNYLIYLLNISDKSWIDKTNKFHGLIPEKNQIPFKGKNICINDGNLYHGQDLVCPQPGGDELTAITLHQNNILYCGSKKGCLYILEGYNFSETDKKRAYKKGSFR